MISRRAVQWDSSPGQRILFDSGTDFAVLGHCFSPIYTYPNSNIALTSGIRNDGSPIYATLCDGETVAQDLTGNYYLLRYHYAINHCDKPLQESLLQPLQIRNSGNFLHDKHLHEGSSEPSQSLVISDTTILLLSNGVHIYLLGRKPTDFDRENLPVLCVTKPNSWEPASQLQLALSAKKTFLSNSNLSSRRTGAVDDNNNIDRSAPIRSEPHNSYPLIADQYAALPQVEVPINELVGHRKHRKIWEDHIPTKKFVYINNAFVPFEDPNVDDLQPEPRQDLIDKWSSILCTNSKEIVAATLRHTTQRHTLIEADPLQVPLQHHKSRFPQANPRRCTGIVYTDTAFANTQSIWTQSWSFQVFVIMPSGKVEVILMPRKECVPTAVKSFSLLRGYPNHLHGDRASELQYGETEKFCKNHNITLSATGAINTPEQNTHAEHMVGVLKRLTSRLLKQSGLPAQFWNYAIKYAAIIWNSTSKRRLQYATPDQLFFGDTPDISHLRFPFGCTVSYRAGSQGWPVLNGIKQGIYLGPNPRDGDAFTYHIYCPTAKSVTSRTTVYLDPTTIPFRLPTSMALTFFKDKKRKMEIQDTSHNDWVPAIINQDKIINLNPTHPKHGTIKTNTSPGGAGAMEGTSIARRSISDNSLLIGRKFFIRKHDNDTQASLVQVRKIYTPTDGVPRLYLTSLSNHSVSSSDDPEQALIPDEDYMLTIEELSQRTDDAISKRDLMPIAITDHKSNGLQPVVRVTWNTNEQTWELVSDMKTHSLPLLLKYVNDNNLQDRIPWRWSQQVDVIQRRCAARLYEYTKTSQPPPCISHEQLVLRRVINKLKPTIKKHGLIVPRNVKHAYELDRLSGTKFWTNAIKKELDTMNKNDVFEILPAGQRAPAGYKFAPLHMVFDVKPGGVGKARFVAGGHVVDASAYPVYASVLKSENFRMLLTIASDNKLKVVTGDIGGAYLNAPAKEKIYSKAGPEFSPFEGHVVLIKRALYGLKTSAGAWWEHLASSLRSMGFSTSTMDPNVWLLPRMDDDNTLLGYDYICVHVDDFAVFATDPTQYISQLSKHYTIRHVTPITDHSLYLGMDLHAFPAHDYFGISGKTYALQAVSVAEQLLGITLPKRETPLDPNVNYELPSTEPLDSGNHAIYRQLVGILQWTGLLSRIDMTYPSRLLSRFTAGPLEQHLEGCQYSLGYLKKYPSYILPVSSNPIPADPSSPVEVADSLSQIDLFKMIYPDAEESIDHDHNPRPIYPNIPLTCYVDSDWASDKSNRRSVTGFIIYLGSTPIEWCSKAQSMVETSTYSSEFIALKTAVEHIKGVRNTLRSFGVHVTSPTDVRCDNKSVVSNAVIANSNLRNRQVGIAYHMVRECVAADIVRVWHILSEKNRSDFLTKKLKTVKQKSSCSMVFTRKQF